MSFQQQAIDAIRATGGRITDQRQLLLQLLASSDDYIDAEKLHQLAARQDDSISLPTVYRTLNTLEEASLISPHYLSSDHERKVYRVAAPDDALHFTCRRCHRVVPFQSDLIQQLKTELAGKLGAEVFNLCICADGLCEECRKREEQ